MDFSTSSDQDQEGRDHGLHHNSVLHHNNQQTLIQVLHRNKTNFQPNQDHKDLNHHRIGHHHREILDQPRIAHRHETIHLSEKQLSREILPTELN